jgi:hypothetical protein
VRDARAPARAQAPGIAPNFCDPGSQRVFPFKTTLPHVGILSG